MSNENRPAIMPPDIVQAKRTEELFAQFKVHSEEDLGKALECTKQVKRLHERYTEKLAEIIDPLKESEKKARELFAPVLESFKRAEDMLKRQMTSFIESREEQRLIASQTEGGAIVPAPIEAPGLQVRRLRDFRVTNEALLPREVLAPDTKKIKALLDAGVEVPGVEVYYKTSLAVSK